MSKKSENGDATTQDASDWYFADPKSLHVKADFQRLIPLQSKGELMAMEESIKKKGNLDPLHVWKGKDIVLDGHTRRELCIKNKKQVKVREIELEDEKAAIAYILEIQRQRRNLTREAMSYFRGSEYNATKKQHGGKRGRKPKDQNDPLPTTAQVLAKKFGVAEMTIKRDALFARAVDKIVEDYGKPDIRRQLLGADVKLTQGTAKVLLKMAAKERKAAVDQLVKDGELPRAKRGSSTGPRPKQLAQSLVARLQVKGDKHARSVVEQMAGLLGLEVVEKAEAE